MGEAVATVMYGFQRKWPLHPESGPAQRVFVMNPITGRHDALTLGRNSLPSGQELPLIRHIVFFTARDRKDLPQIVEGLNLLGTIPYVGHFDVAENARIDQIGNEVDVVVYAEFADEAALAAYKAHPTYAEATRRVRPLREMRLAADFEAAAEAALPVRRMRSV
jgi:hypothetical protein